MSNPEVAETFQPTGIPPLTEWGPPAPGRTETFGMLTVTSRRISLPDAVRLGEIAALYPGCANDLLTWGLTYVPGEFDMHGRPQVTWATDDERWYVDAMSKAQRAGLPYVLTGDSQVVAKELRGSPDTRPYVTAWMVAPSDRHVFLKFLTAGIAKAACDPSGVIAGIVERRLGINTSTQDTGA